MPLPGNRRLLSPNHSSAAYCQGVVPLLELQNILSSLPQGDTEGAKPGFAKCCWREWRVSLLPAGLRGSCNINSRTFLSPRCPPCHSSSLSLTGPTARFSLPQITCFLVAPGKSTFSGIQAKVEGLTVPLEAGWLRAQTWGSTDLHASSAS